MQPPYLPSIAGGLDADVIFPPSTPYLGKPRQEDARARVCTNACLVIDKLLGWVVFLERSKQIDDVGVLLIVSMME